MLCNCSATRRRQGVFFEFRDAFVVDSLTDLETFVVNLRSGCFLEGGGSESPPPSLVIWRSCGSLWNGNAANPSTYAAPISTATPKTAIGRIKPGSFWSKRTLPTPTNSKSSCTRSRRVLTTPLTVCPHAIQLHDRRPSRCAKYSVSAHAARLRNPCHQPHMLLTHLATAQGSMLGALSVALV